MAGPHIIVIGLGAMGSAALCHLARRGVRATGIEQFPLRHENGSSHGPTRIIRLAHFENSSYVPLLRRAYALWRGLEEIAQQTLVVKTGIAEIGPPDGELIRGTLAAASHYRLAHTVLDAKSLMQRYPSFKLPETFVAVLQPDGGYIEAAAAIDANIRIATAAGALVRTSETVTAIEPHATGVRIRTNRALIDADGVIVAAGPWVGKLLPDLRLPLRITRQVVGWFEPKDAVTRLPPDHFPVFIASKREHGHHWLSHLWLVRNEDREASPCARSSRCRQLYRRTVSTRRTRTVARAPLSDYLPAANGRLLSAQTCLYTMTPDDTFIIDCMPGHPHVVIASPCCGHGFKFSPVVGEILADLSTRGETAHDIRPFRLERFA